MDRFSMLLALGCTVLISGAQAAPYNPAPYTVYNGGDSLTLQRIGDEHYSYTRTTDGILVLPGDDGIYYYADENGNITDIRAKNSDRRSERERARLNKVDQKKAFRAHRKNTPIRVVPPKSERVPKRAPWLPTGESSSSSTYPPVLRIPSPANHSSGTNRFPIVLMQLANAKNSLDSAGLYAMLNADNYTTNGYTGSIREYFRDQSNGKFIPTFDIYCVSVNKQLSDYNKNQDYQLTVDAINALAAIPEFDASPYDADNDGSVDMIGVLFSGTDNTDLGGYQYKLQWNTSQKISAGGKRMNTYFLINQVGFPFPTIIHEFSHTLGLMDHYCVDYEGTGVCDNGNGYQIPGTHSWDIMATGMYNNNGKTPAGYNAFERAFMGWLDYTTLSASSSVTAIGPLNTTNMAYRIPVNGNNDEWYILENRQHTRWDAKLPGHGMLIWHIDYNRTKWDGNAMNSDPAHQNVDIVEAGTLKVTSYYDGFETTHLKDDPFPGSQNVTGYGPFKAWDGTDLNIQLYNITEKDNNVCFTTSSGVPVNDCTLASSSSVAESSSSVAITSSSAAVSSSSETPASSSSTGVLENIEIAVTIPVSDHYDSTVQALDAQHVAKVLGIAAGEIATKATYYGVNADGSLNPNSTANAPGHWFDAQGNTCSWNESDPNVRLFAEMDLSAMSVSLGHMPGNVKAGETYTVRQALAYNGNQVTFTFQVKIASDTTVAVAISRRIDAPASLTLAGNILRVQSATSAPKQVQIFDMQGNLVATHRFDGNETQVDLTRHPRGELIVRLVAGGKTEKTARISLR